MNHRPHGPAIASSSLLIGAGRRWLMGLLVLVGPLLFTASSAAQRTGEVLTLYVGQAHVLEEGPVKRIVIGNGKVFQATSMDDRQLLILPETTGQSTLHLWLRSGQEKVYVINVVTADSDRLQAEVRAILGESPGFRVRVVGDKVIVEGTNLSEEQAMRLSEVAKRYPQLVNLVSRVGMERMIAMDVKMVEIKRDVLRNIGIKWSGSAQGPSFGIIGDLHRSGAFGAGGVGAAAGVEARARVAPFATALGLASSITSIVNFLVTNGDAVLLAEPQLSCRSGGTARFIAGGELPIPYSSGLGNVSVLFKEYGVKFDVSPVANEAGIISAKIATEISAINFDVTVKEVPGLTKRRAETEVNLREHETLVIAGLLSEEAGRSVEKVAGLGDLPILGPLFRSRQFRERVTDLIVLITPRFVGEQSPNHEETTANAKKKVERARELIRMVD